MGVGDPRLRTGTLLLVLAVLVAACRAAAPPPGTVAPPAGGPLAAGRPAGPPGAATAFLDTLQQRTFGFFWELSDSATGLTPDRWPTPSFSSVAAIGFALTAYPVGVERGWIGREAAEARVLATLRFLWTAPQGADPSGVTGHRGFFYHFLDMEQGRRFETVELSTIDTALLMAGVLAAQAYFDAPADSGEAAIRALADSLYLRVDWEWAQARPNGIAMAWRPDEGFSTHDWKGYNEAMILLVLALGSPTHPVPPAAWDAWTNTYRWGTLHGYEHLGFAPLFGHQYSHVWIDFRGIQDEYMRARGIDYFENSRRATLAQREYAIANPAGWAGYGPQAWGLTASDGPADTTVVIGGREREFRTYWARGAGPFHAPDDGTIAPTAAGGSVPFAPEVAIPVLAAMRRTYGDHLFGEYGFRDAFNPTFAAAGVAPETGRVVPGGAWFDVDYLGIDQGPILLMIENHRTGFVWELMKRSPYVVRGLCRAGFRGGWLEAEGRCERVAAGEAIIDSLLAAMTIEEKAGQLSQYSGGWSEAEGAPRIRDEHIELIRQGQVGSFLNAYGAEHLHAIQRIAVEESRLGIPLLFAHDVIHGFRTIFPVPLAEAASWDPAAVAGAARIAALEATAYGLHWTFAPMVDIARDSRWGRIVEGSGEDPHLGSVMARAKVRGFQGDNLALDTTLLATAKHYAAYGGAEGGRDYGTVDVSMRTLREVYLPPFRAAVEAGVGAIMAAFNEIAGVPMHAHAALIDGVLRGEWGFGGVVVSDYTGVKELQAHGIAATPAEAARRAILAGVDIDMMSDIYRTELPGLVAAGLVRVEAVDRAVRRVLEAKMALGLFDDPYRYGDPAREESVALTAEHRAAARELARRSIVLLKNEGGVLPLEAGGPVAVIGPLAADSVSPLGSWAAAGRAEDVVTVLDGIRAAAGRGAPVVGRRGRHPVRYAQGADVAGGDTSGFAEAAALARQSDAVVLVLGEDRDMSGEAASRSSLELPGVQRELAERVVAAARPGTPVVAVLMNGRPLAVPWLAEHVPAILEAWFLGVEMGHAVADVLFGVYNPGGKLPVTFPRATGQVPIYYAHKSTGRPPSEERFTSKYLDLPSTPLWPFGHGLSYTEFEYRDLGLSRTSMTAADTLMVTVDVTNAGARAGDEVVQLYIRDDVASVTRPVRELRGFRRIGIAPGGTETVTFAITAGDLAFWGPDERWIVEPGDFTVFAGGSSVGGLEASFEVVGETTPFREE